MDLTVKDIEKILGEFDRLTVCEWTKEKVEEYKYYTLLLELQEMEY